MILVEKKLSKIRFALKSGMVFRILRRKKVLRKAESEKDLALRNNKIASVYVNYQYDCLKPRTFNERIAWLKLFYRNDFWSFCADKLGSKKFIEDIGLGSYLPKVFGPWDKTADIDLRLLPERFVIKTNHDSGSVFVCDKRTTNFEIVFKKLDESMKNRYESTNEEWVYERIKPVIFAEELLEPEIGDDLCDYKFFCFAGEPRFLFTASGRSKDVRFGLYDIDFKQLNSCYIHLKPVNEIRSKYYEEMLRLSKLISSYFEFVRVDFFPTKNGLKIGELTFFSESGHGCFSNKRVDFELGKLFDKTKFGPMFGNNQLFVEDVSDNPWIGKNSSKTGGTL